MVGLDNTPCGNQPVQLAVFSDPVKRHFIILLARQGHGNSSTCCVGSVAQAWRSDRCAAGAGMKV